jgi:hypothetical protein
MPGRLPRTGKRNSNIFIPLIHGKEFTAVVTANRNDARPAPRGQGRFYRCNDRDRIGNPALPAIFVLNTMPLVMKVVPWFF